MEPSSHADPGPLLRGLGPLKERHKEEFLAHAARELKTPSGPAVDPEAAARAVFGVLAKKVSEGELQDILGLLPKELKELWPKA